MDWNELKEKLKSDDIYERMQAADFIGFLGADILSIDENVKYDPKVFGQYLSSLNAVEPGNWKLLRSAFLGSDPGFKHSAMGAFINAGDRVTDQLASLYEECDENDKIKILKTLCRIRSRKAVRLLSRYRFDSSSHIRYFTARALGLTKRKDAVPWLLKLTSDRMSLIRTAAANMIEAIDPAEFHDEGYEGTPDEALVIVFGITGLPASGKDTAGRFIRNEMESQGLLAFPLGFSNELRQYILTNKPGDFDREVLSEVGGDLRRRHGPEALAVRICNRIDHLRKYYKAPNILVFVVEGYRTLGEVEEFRRRFGGRFFLLSLIADEGTIINRLRRRKRFDEAKTLNDSDQAAQKILQDELGHSAADVDRQVARVMDEADATITNSGSIEDLEMLVLDETLKFIQNLT